MEPEVQKAGPSKPGKKTKSWALKTLVDEVSDGSDSDYGNIMPPTPPVPTATEDEVVEVVEEPLDQEGVETEEHLQEKDHPVYTESDDDDADYHESDDDSDYQEDNEEIGTTWNAYYETGKATTIRETLLVMFYRHLTECFGGCKKVSQAILHTQHVRRIHDFLDPNKDDATFESLLKDGEIVVWRSWEMLMFVPGSGDGFPEYLKGGKISG